MSDYVLENGADVELVDLDETRCYDRVILTNGFAVCINKRAYSKDVYPTEKVESLHTHTSNEEESAEWW